MNNKLLFNNAHKIDNYDFYACSLGHEILNSKNFSSDIMDFLNAEYDIFLKILLEHKNKYDVLLEIGCGQVRNITLAAQLKLKYFGIDFIENEIKAAQQKIKINNFIGKVKCLSVLDLDPMTTPIPRSMRTVSLFPFNVFGNIFQPTRVLQVMKNLNYDSIISSYRDDIQKQIIINYYEACGLKNIKMINLPYGTMFLSQEDFQSIIYTSEYIKHIASQLNLTVECFEFSNLGKLYYIH